MWKNIRKKNSLQIYLPMQEIFAKKAIAEQSPSKNHRCNRIPIRYLSSRIRLPYESLIYIRIIVVTGFPLDILPRIRLPYEPQV